MATNINFDKKLGVTGGTGISLPSASTPPSFASTNSFSFDGVDDFFLGTSTYSELNGTTKATWSIWLKPNLSGTQVISRVSSSTSSTAFVYQFVILASGEVYMQIGDTTRRSRTGTNVLTANVWSHILVTYDGTLANGSKTKMFINGVDSTSTDTTTATSLNPSNYSLQIGRRDFGTVINYGGLIDEFAIWNSTDQRANVNEIYNGGTPNDLNTLPTAPQPTTWQRMGEGATWNGFAWTMTDVNGGYTNRGVAMVEANRTTDVPPNPFTNTLSTTFDGVDDYVDLGTNSNLVFLGARSMSVWLKFTDNGSTRYVANFNSDQQGMYTNSGKVYFFNRDASFTWKTIATINTYNDNQWYNFIGINDGTNLKMYVNGVLVNSNTNGSVGNTNLNKQRIGARWNGNNVFSGLMDELSYYNSDISANASAIYNEGVPTSLASYSPLGWWRMGDGSTYPTINDLGSGSNNGTMTNMSSANFVTDVPTFNVYSTLFDGIDDYVDCGDSDDFSFGNGVTDSPFSISTWVKMNDATKFRAIGKYGASDIEYLLSTNATDKIAFNCYDSSTSARIGRQYSVALTSLQGTWINLIATYDGSRNSSGQKIYLNGIRVDNTDSNSGSYTAMENTTQPLYIGKLTTSYADGNVDETAIFNSELSASDVTSIYNSGVPNDISSLSPVSFWRMGDNDTYPTINDVIGSNDGTMNNMSSANFVTDVPT